MKKFTNILISTQLEEVLNHSSGERQVASFLAKHPALVRWAFAWTGGHSAYVLHEFPFGHKYKADFVIVTSWSGSWEAIFIELEPVGEKLVTKKGTVTQRVGGAIKQLLDWHDYIDKNRAQVQDALADFCMTRDKLKWVANNREPSSYSGDRLRDHRTHVKFEFGILAGRRSNITPTARAEAQKYGNFMNFRLRTYDACLDIARKLDQVDENTELSVCLIDRESE